MAKQFGLANTIAALGVLLTGCSSLRPVRGAVPEVGSKVAFDVNDAGRLALGGSMGPEISQVEGQLIEKDSTGYLLSVSSVRLLRGGEQVWSGEQVRLKSEYLGNVYERRFSLGRSLILGAATFGGFGAFLATRSLLGSGTSDSSCPNPPCDTIITRLGRP